MPREARPERGSTSPAYPIGTAIAILKPRRLPVTEHSTVLDSAYVSN